MLMENKIWNDWLVLRPMEKRLDIYSAGRFKEQVLEMIQTDPCRLLLDLSHIEFMDSSGLGSIISIFKTISGRGELALCNIKPTVMSLFRLTRMDRVFEIYNSEIEAMNHGKLQTDLYGSTNFQGPTPNATTHH